MATDSSDKMRENVVDRLLVQADYKVTRDKGQVLEALDALWRDPGRAGEIMGEFRAESEDLYRFEKMLDTLKISPSHIRE